MVYIYDTNDLTQDLLQNQQRGRDQKDHGFKASLDNQ
jgi:hypothetical protein